MKSLYFDQSRFFSKKSFIEAPHSLRKSSSFHSYFTISPTITAVNQTLSDSRMMKTVVPVPVSIV